eukprot:9785565-Heterocapsa_arctica.AAC.1
MITQQLLVAEGGVADQLCGHSQLQDEPRWAAQVHAVQPAAACSWSVVVGVVRLMKLNESVKRRLPPVCTRGRDAGHDVERHGGLGDGVVTVVGSEEVPVTGDDQEGGRGVGSSEGRVHGEGVGAELGALAVQAVVVDVPVDPN